MSADNRSVSTDALETLGTIIGTDEKRDAIHLAVEPAIAAHTLRPGEDVGFVEGGVGICDAPLGIVDPFLKANVKKGERFWLVVYPRQIKSLRHVWEHPSFPASGETHQDAPGNPFFPTDSAGPKPLGWTQHAISPTRKRISEAWLREFCQTSDCPDYDIVIAAASGQPLPDVEDYGTAYFNDGEYLYFNGRDAHASIPPEFWDHVEVVTGETITSRPTFFTCSC